MTGHPQTKARLGRIAANVAAAWSLAALLALAGCQGLSSGPASSPPPQQPSGSLALNVSSLDFGTVTVGKNKSLTLTASNNSSVAVKVSSAKSNLAPFALSSPALPLTISAGQTATLTVSFSPTSTGSVKGSISVASDASNSPANLILNGDGVLPGTLSVSPTTMAFGSVLVGNSQKQSGTLTNTGGSDLNLSQVSTSGAGFSLTGLSLPLTLPAGQSASFTVTFAPHSATAVNGNIAFTSDGSNPTLNLPLSGSGLAIGSLSPSPGSLNFGSVITGKNSTLPETLTNSSSASVTVTQVSSGDPSFSVSGLNLPLTIGPNQNASFNVVFAPQSSGPAGGNLIVTSDASNPQLVIPLSGSGVAPGTLSPNPASLVFGNVVVGKNQTLPETLTNTGASNLTISQDTLIGMAFSVSGLNLPLTLMPGQQASFKVTFLPQSAGNASGSLTLTSDGSNPTVIIPLSGVGLAPGTLSPNPASLSFGNVQVGHNRTLPETVTNTGGSNATISQDSVTNGIFSVSGLNPPVTLTPGQKITFNVIFTPAVSGNAGGNLTVVSDASNPNLVISLSGAGTPAGQLSVNPASLDFGNVTVGNNSSLPASLNASGASVTVTSANSSSPEFTLSGISFPVTIQAGSNANFTVTFTPQATGQANATLSFASDASNSPTVQSLTGKGIAPQHSVLLSWTASVTLDVVGYNVYRGTQSGGPYSKINSSLDPTISYTDSTVSNGTTYYYVARAVDSSNQESGNSNEAKAIIP